MAHEIERKPKNVQKTRNACQEGLKTERLNLREGKNLERERPDADKKKPISLDDKIAVNEGEESFKQ